MRPEFVLRTRVLLLSLFVGSHFATSGCNDESKTSGTMVQVTEEQKAQIKSRSAAYKAQRQKYAVKGVSKNAKNPEAQPPR
jgi:hypothetical protein